MRQIPIFFISCFLVFFFSSCANYKLNYSKSGKNWEQQQPTGQLEHRMYLIGDAGNAPLNETTNVLTYLKKQLAKESENSSIVYLGDNLYPVGMPPKGEEADRVLAEQWGLKGLKREENFIEEYLNRGIEDEDDWGNYFMPDGGCPGPEVLELNENLVMIIIDSQWWLADWDREPKINDGCEVKNRKQLQFFVENAMRKHRRKNVVIAMHHPLFTNGPHGGSSTAKQHVPKRMVVSFL